MDKAEIYRQSIDHLEKVVEILEHGLGRPQLEHEVFTYKDPSVKHACFLKAVRIVSAINALLVLLDRGYVTEMGVLMRTTWGSPWASLTATCSGVKSRQCRS